MWGKMDFDLKQSGFIIKRLTLEHKEKSYKCILSITKYDEIPNSSTVLKRLIGAEYDKLKEFKYEKRKKSYFLGRYSCINAINHYTGIDNQNVLIENGIFNQPIVRDCPDKTFQVSITHSGNLGGAIAFDERLIMGIDIEVLNSNYEETIENHLTLQERLLIKDFSNELVGLATIWTAKESLSKALKTGMMTSFDLLELDRVIYTDNDYLCFYKNFPQYKSKVFTIDNYVCSITYPAHMTIYWV